MHVQASWLDVQSTLRTARPAPMHVQIALCTVRPAFMALEKAHRLQGLLAAQRACCTSKFKRIGRVALKNVVLNQTVRV